MADRVSASIVLGGTLTASAFAELVEIIANEGLSVDWDGETFVPAQRVPGQPLSLCACEVAWGNFDELETWCFQRQLPFVRWSGGCAGSFGPERLVSRSDGTQTLFAVTDDDEVMVSRDTVAQLGNYETILAHFAAADFVVPPLVVDGDDVAACPPAACDRSPAEGTADVE